MKPKFGNDLTNVILRQSQVVQTRMAGRAVIKVVNRCNDAKENNSLSTYYTCLLTPVHGWVRLVGWLLCCGGICDLTMYIFLSSEFHH